VLPPTPNTAIARTPVLGNDPAPILAQAGGNKRARSNDAVDYSVVGKKSLDDLSKQFRFWIQPTHIFRATYQQSLQKWKQRAPESRLQLVSDLWRNTHEEVYPTHGPSWSWEANLKGHCPGSKGYGEALPPLFSHMLKVHQKYSSSNSGREISSQTFVDIGSGICNVVLQMAALQPDFRYCHGIELETPRAAFAREACDVFTKKAGKERIPFCEVEAEQGDCFTNSWTNRALKIAGLVWTNNEIFQSSDNLRLFKYLNSVVPVGCIIMSFSELIVTKRGNETTPLSTERSDFKIHPPVVGKALCSWIDPRVDKKVFIIQRMSRFYANQ